MRLLLCFLILCVCTAMYGQELPLLKVSDDDRYLVTEDGEPFFWLGGTAWELLHRLDKKETSMYLEDRASKGFTVVQTVVLAELDGLRTPNAEGAVPLIDMDPTKLNEPYFENVDHVIRQAESLGMYVALLPTWGDKFNLARWGTGPTIFTPDNAESFGHQLAERYLDFNNIIWVLGGDRWPEDDEDRAIINRMAKGIRAVDSRHLITYHPNGNKKGTDYFNESWMDFDMFQSGHDRRVLDFAFVESSHEVVPKRPVVNGEPRYENHPNRFRPQQYGWMDDSDIRASAYWTMLAGGAGYTYGSHDIWQMYDAGREAINGARTSWKVSLDLPGSRQLTYMKRLFEAFPWQEMQYDPSLINGANNRDSTYQIAAIGPMQDFVIAYTPFGEPLDLNISTMKGEKVDAYWYNPRDGRSQKINSFDRSESIQCKPWSVGRGSDMLLILISQGAGFTLPGL